MQRIVLVAGLLALVAPAQLAVTEPAHAQVVTPPGRDAPPGCQTHVLPNTPTANLGECVALVNNFWRSPDHGLVAQLCDAVMETAPGFFFSLYGSYSECIRDEGDRLPPFP